MGVRIISCRAAQVVQTFFFQPFEQDEQTQNMMFVFMTLCARTRERESVCVCVRVPKTSVSSAASMGPASRADANARGCAREASPAIAQDSARKLAQVSEDELLLNRRPS